MQGYAQKRAQGLQMAELGKTVSSAPQSLRCHRFDGRPAFLQWIKQNNFHKELTVLLGTRQPGIGQSGLFFEGMFNLLELWASQIVGLALAYSQ